MKSIRSLTLLGAAALLVAAVPVLAQGPSPGMPPGGPRGPEGPSNPAIGMAGRALHDLSLSRDQERQIHDLVRGYMEGELGQELRAAAEARRTLELLVWDPDAGEPDLLAAIQAAGADERVELARHALAKDILQVLTEEQRADFRQSLENAPRPPDHPGPDGRRGPRPRSR